MSINELIELVTDTATLAVYDPETIKYRVDDEIDWWACDFHLLEEVQSGIISLISLQNDGFYKIRVTTGNLVKDEINFAREKIGPLGVTSKSGKIFLGKGECLPGGGDIISPDHISSHDGKFIELPTGDYDLNFYYINASEYASEEMVNSLPDIVITISRRINSFAGISTEPRINSTIKTFLNPSKVNANKLAPELNKILKARVWKTTRTTSGKSIVADKDEIWPESYRRFDIVLEDMSKVEWKDRIVIKTTRLDVENNIIYAVLMEKPTTKQKQGIVGSVLGFMKKMIIFIIDLYS